MKQFEPSCNHIGNFITLNHFRFLAVILASVATASACLECTGQRIQYRDGRPTATLRIDAIDNGLLLSHGNGPDRCDEYGAREAIAFEHQGKYYLHYDGAGLSGWRACLAVSRDLEEWKLMGPVLDLGPEGSNDSASASSPWVIHEEGRWHMFYLGTPNASPPPDRVPRFPYLTLRASSDKPYGPWKKQYSPVPFTTRNDTFYSATASPGHIVNHNGEYLMFFSGSTHEPLVKRTIGIARTKDLNSTWKIDSNPIVPLEEQIENSSLYFEEASGLWYLFTNHIGINEQGQEYTDAIWVYWSQDLNQWDTRRKAVVLDGENCNWSTRCIGMPSVLRVGDRLAIFYDAPGGENISHMHRDIGLAWLDLPLENPSETHKLGLSP